MNDIPAVNDFIQANRLLRIETPFGADAFLMESFSGREAVNELFAFEVVVRAKRDDVKPQDLVGKNVDVSLDRGDEGPRRVWNGLVVGLTEEPRLTRALRQYVLTLRPDLWLLSQKSDCRIWQNKTSVEIAETLLSEHGLRAPDVAGVLNTPAPQEYSIQWNETDLAFLLRRLEEDGLFYWVRQSEGMQTVVVADNPNAWDDGADGEAGATRFASGSTDRDHIGTWTRRYAFTPGKRAGRDWNFETPTVTPGTDTPSLVKLPRNGAYELYEYPARALDLGASETAMKLRMQSVEADHERVEGASTTRTLAPGAKVTPYDVAHPEHMFETSVITAIEHFARDTTYETGSDHPIYSNSFEASPARLPLTPHRRTPRPRIDGTQIAIVAGPSGEEIHTEQYGRIKLWFPWDRRAKKDGSDTKWIRVGQSWGGGGWGAQIIPRIGMEVAVSYLDGDPDRPLVVGVVPNPSNYVPYGLPANKTRSVFRTNTHKSKDVMQFNELSFEDKEGAEEIYLHAQKDHNLHIENNRAKRVDNNQSESVGHNKSIEIGNNHHEVIGGNMTLMVGPNVLQSFVTQGFKALTDAVSGLASKLGVPDVLNMGEGNLVIGVGKNKAETVMVSSTEIVGAAKASTIGGGYQLTVGGVKNESVAVGSWEEVGQTKVTVVGHKYEIVCGKSRILMERDGTITIEGVSLKINKEKDMTVKAGQINMN